MNRPLWTRSRQPDPCDAIDILLSLYADGMASEEESNRVEVHLPDCVSCRQSLLWMQATRRALSSRPVLLPPADLRARISTAIAASSAAPAPVRSARIFVLRPAYAAAASLTLIGVLAGYGLLKSKPIHVLPVSPAQVAVQPHADVSIQRAHPVQSRHPLHTMPSAVIALLPKPRIKARTEHLASSRIKDAPRVAPSPIPALKPQSHVLTAAVVQTSRVPLKKPVLPVSPPRLMASHPSSATVLDHTPSVVTPNRSAVPDTAVATNQISPAPVSPSTEPPTIIRDDSKPIVTASAPPTNDNRFHTVDLSMVREYAQANRTNIAHDLNLAGRTAIRTAVHITPLTGLDTEAGKIDITHGDIH